VSATRSATLPLAGDYLETRFIETLKKARSIIAADKACYDLRVAQLLTVIATPNGFSIGQIEGWHEGQNLFDLMRDGELKNGWDNDGDTTVEILDRHHIRIRMASLNQEENFVYVGNDAKFIRHYSLVGKYIDDAGKPYEFKDDGTGTFSDKPFTYRLNLDDFPGDSFSAQNRIIAFRWKGSELTLYPSFPVEPDAEGYGTPDLTHPIAHLHRVH
jgi:hypothetical protein